MISQSLHASLHMELDKFGVPNFACACTKSDMFWGSEASQKLYKNLL